MLHHFERIAEFEDASAISASPDGSYYVVDQGSSTIHHFNKDGQFIRKLGGPGAGAGQFDFPSAIDPTNGLVLVVADAGNGRIQRFSREFLYLESLPVGEYERGAVASFPGQPRYRQGEVAELLGSGRPIAVKTTSDNRMYAIDAENNVVVEWDQDRNLTQVIGEYNEGDGTLMNPVAIEIGSKGSLFVLDTALEIIRVYDPFGGYIREMGRGLLANATSLKRVGTLLAVSLPGSVYLFQESGLVELEIIIDIPTSIKDVLFFNGQLLLLESQGLLRYHGDTNGILKLDDP